MRQIILKRGTESLILGTNGEDIIVRGLRLVTVSIASTTAEVSEAKYLLEFLGDTAYLQAQRELQS